MIIDNISMIVPFPVSVELVSCLTVALTALPLPLPLAVPLLAAPVS